MTDSQNIVRFKAKICLLGDPMVGKTSLVRKFVLDQFSDEYIPTVGTKVTKKEISMFRNNKRYYVTFMVWDINGKREMLEESITDFRDFVPTSFMAGAEAVLFVCDLTRKPTLDHLKLWYEGLRSAVQKDVTCVLLGNKADLKDNAEISYDDIMAMNREWGFPFYYTSAKTGENVEMAFSKMAEDILDKL